MPIPRSALLAAATVPGIALAVAVAGSPSLAATTPSATTTSASPTATTRSATTSTTRITTTSTSTSTTRPSSSSTSCYRGPSTTSYSLGTTLAAYRFDTTDVPTAFTADSPVALSVVTDPTGASGGVLKASGMDSAHSVYLDVPTRGWGPFDLSVQVRPDNGLPSQLDVTMNGSLRVTTVALDPRTFLDITASFEAGVLYADWYCNGTMTGGQFPSTTRLQFRVWTTCEGLDPTRTLLLDDISIVRAGTATRRVNPAATTVTPTSTTRPPTTIASTSTTKPPTTVTPTSTTRPATSTTSATTSPTLTCPAVSTTPITTTKTTKSSTTKTSKTKATTTKSPKPTTSKAPSLKCKVTLSAVNSWPSGWSAALQIANFSALDVASWTLTATLPTGETLAYGWPATFTQSGTKLTGTPPSFQSTLKAKSKVNWGLVLGGGTQAPTGWAINGTTCAVSQ